eukprot:GHUV01014768.1.p1 GENE.GHUV01014768.1~~GHUV01014768.1.p1  ORF type:complete len:166 (+),score=39.23 GHUV01014768.1:253-750(+)
MQQHARTLMLQVERKLKQLQQQRAEQLSPSRLYLPEPWQPVEIKNPVTMYKVLAAQDGKFTSVYDKAVQYVPQQWTYARSGSSSGCGWPPLWSCMYAYQDKHQARETVFPRGSQQQHGARVLVRVQVKGKGYQHPDGRVAVSALYVEKVLEYVPKGPADRLICQL